MSVEEGTGGHSDRQFQVPTGPVPASRHHGRGDRIRILVVVAIAALVVALGRLGGGPVPPVPATTPFASPAAPAITSLLPAPAATEPAPSPTGTPLPQLVVLGRSSPPAQLVVEGQQARVLNLATGVLGPPIPGGSGGLFPLAGGSRWLCACESRVLLGGGPTETLAVSAAEYDAAGEPVGSSTPIIDRQGIPPPPGGRGVVAGSALDPNGRWLATALATRSAQGAVTAELAVVTLMGRRGVRSVVLGRVPAKDGVQTMVDQASVEVAPDGAHAVVDVQIDRFDPTRGPVIEHWRWLISIGSDGRTGRVIRFDADPAATAHLMWRASGFATPGMFVDWYDDLRAVDQSLTAIRLRRFGLDGRQLPNIVISSLPTRPSTPVGAMSSLIDGRAGVVYGWDPVRDVLIRVDPVIGQVDASVTGAGTGSSGALAGEGWPLVASSGSLVASPSGRIYAIGAIPLPTIPAMNGSIFASTGVWVFRGGPSSERLAFVDHWEATADSISIALSPDGRWLYAAALPGVDAEGNPSAQEASVTVYQAVSGLVEAIAGRLGPVPVTFIEP